MLRLVSVDIPAAYPNVAVLLVAPHVRIALSGMHQAPGLVIGDWRICVDRIAPPLRSNSVPIVLPELPDSAPVERVKQITDLMLAGDLSPAEASGLRANIATALNIEIDLTVKPRLEALEARLREQDAKKR